jgi:hypothetical protein
MPCCSENMNYANFNSVAASYSYFPKKFRFLNFFPEDTVIQKYMTHLKRRGERERKAIST